MKYQLKTKADYQRFLTTNLTEGTGAEPTVGTYVFDSGMIKVNVDTNTKYFFLNIPVNNLNIGDIVRIQADVKLLGGTIVPNICLSIKGSNQWVGTEGIHRVVRNPIRAIKDFQTITTDAVFEGYTETSLDNPDINNKGLMYARFSVTAGYGTSQFYLKNLSVEKVVSVGGVSPSTKTYFGLLYFNATNKTWTFGGNNQGGSNLKELTISNFDEYTFDINFQNPFTANPMCFATTTYQANANNKYEVVVTTTDTSKARFCVLDRSTNARVTLDSIDKDMYVQFLSIGD